MPVIKLQTNIKSDVSICFNLSLSVDMHTLSTARTNEKAIAGKTTGIMQLNEYVTWEATHFGVTQTLTSKITQLTQNLHFRDEQQKGAFKHFVHDHNFETINGMVIMTDTLNFSSPFGFIVTVVDKIILTKYLKTFLIERNALIKTCAESEQWKQFLQ